jgi:AcrR family transcriptional regulator
MLSFVPRTRYIATDTAEALMTEVGVNGLTLAEVVRRVGVQTPTGWLVRAG